MDDMKLMHISATLPDKFDTCYTKQVCDSCICTVLLDCVFAASIANGNNAALIVLQQRIGGTNACGIKYMLLLQY